jgi:hypothetical protein
MTWYHLTDKAFLYEGDLQLLGIDPNQELPSDVVLLVFTDCPISSNPLIEYHMGEPVFVNNEWQTSWVEVVHTEEELDEIKAAQDQQIAAFFDYLTPKPSQD